MVQALNPPVTQAALTLADFLALPETKPASEFIDGEISQKPMPKGKHSIVQRELTFTIDRPLTAQKLARAFPELRCTYPAGSRNSVYDGRSIVPDITVFKTDRIPRDPDGTVANDFDIAPDWTIEILSPDQSHTKVVKNIVHCLKNGTTIGWLIDPADRTIFAYYPNGTMEIFDTPEARLPVPEFAQSIGLTVGEIFGWLTN
jgi:Uma2 family endonuclease